MIVIISCMIYLFLPVQSETLPPQTGAGFLLGIRPCGKGSYIVFVGAMPGVLYS